MIRGSATALLLGVLAAAFAGCGGIKPADLFIVMRVGPTPQRHLTLLINEEGGVRCNFGPTLKLSDSQLVRARAIQEEIHDAASSHLSLAPRSGWVFSYTLRDENGKVHFSDNSAHQPPVLHQLQLLVLDVAQQVCHKP